MKCKYCECNLHNSTPCGRFYGYSSDFGFNSCLRNDYRPCETIRLQQDPETIRKASYKRSRKVVFYYRGLTDSNSL